MRREDDTWRSEERIAGRQGLRVRDIECDPAGHRDSQTARGTHDRGLVDEAPARRVHDHCAGPERGERRVCDQVLRRREERRVQADVVGTTNQVVDRDELGTVFGGRRAVGHWIRDENGRIDRAGLADECLPDPSEADHTERELVEPADPGADLGDALRVSLPDAVVDCPVERDDPALDREEQRQRVIGNLLDRRIRDVRDDDPESRCRLDVNVVVPDAATDDGLDRRQGLERRGVERLDRAQDHD
jgi:hypothetical protein